MSQAGPGAGAAPAAITTASCGWSSFVRQSLRAHACGRVSATKPGGRHGRAN